MPEEENVRPFARLMLAEALKLRRSAALRLVWLLPLLFLLIEWTLMERPILALDTLTPKLRSNLDSLQLKALVGLWAGFFHPLSLALLPALVFRPEHRFRTWRHLHALPVPRRGIFLAKALSSLALIAAMLLLTGLLLWMERRAMGWMNPLAALPFHGPQVARILGWLWLGSLPVLGLYLWVSDRINSLAVPVVFGLLGLLLTVSLTGQELPKPWRRDLNPWVLPYAAAEQIIHQGPTQQQAHAASTLFQPEKDVLRLPTGKKIRTWQNVPDEVLFPPPPPTPAWLLATFSTLGGLLLFVLGWMDAGRNRS